MRFSLSRQEEYQLSILCFVSFTRSENAAPVSGPRSAWLFILDSLFLVTVFSTSGTLRAALSHLLVIALPVSYSANNARTSGQAVRGHWLTPTWMEQHLCAQCKVGGEGKWPKDPGENSIPYRLPVRALSSLSFVGTVCLPTMTSALGQQPSCPFLCSIA